MIKEEYDIAVIGGGPAGMMAAGTAAQKGARVILLEKNSRPGRKLLITGKGRCNITNAEHDTGQFIEAFGKNGKFLYSGLHAFSVEDTIRFFNDRGLATRVERGRRVFPETDRSEDVLSILFQYLKEGKVSVRTNTVVSGFKNKNNTIEAIQFDRGEVRAGQYILCTGGLSYPSTGSSGDGLKWAKELGHTLIKCKPGLVPVKIKEEWVKELQGLSLKNVRISLFQKSKMDDRFGEALFTHEGLSGPIILDLSKRISELIDQDGLTLHVDYKPALEYNKLDERIQRDFKQDNKKMFKNCLSGLLPKKMIPIIIRLSGIDPVKPVHNITRDERKKLTALLKEMIFHVRGLGGYDKAVITIGGIALPQIDPRTMRSRIIENLFFAGEIIDLDGPTGGYNLQVCWSTGYLAGASAVS
ncbi:MAG: NAD(P)/FAD-dependent oxidoreductase [Spirochaetes bacterium]|nr:NAD(P)/FAD-dependent oxidoreductase [Spirochaetota bacterium]